MMSLKETINEIKKPFWMSSLPFNDNCTTLNLMLICAKLAVNNRNDLNA